MSNIKCNGVKYRQGFIEVISQIHDEHINIETWNVHPDIELTNSVTDIAKLKDDEVVANTEIELTVEQAQSLINHLNVCIKSIKERSKNAT